MHHTVPSRGLRAPVRRRAFTVIELLIVIGIIALLAALAGYAMTGVYGRQKAQATRVTLHTLKSLVAEYELKAKGLARQPDSAYTDNGSNVQTFSTGPLDVWHDANPTDPGPVSPTNPEPDPFPAPSGTLRKDAVTNPLAATRYNHPAIYNTQKIIGMLQAIPTNRTALSQLPASQLMSENVPVVPNGLSVPAGGGVPNPPIVLDAWGNPIIFVPAGGLYNLTVGDVPRLAVPTAGQYNGPIQSKDKRPFWASAGPDGNFATGDDNIYSFEE